MTLASQELAIGGFTVGGILDKSTHIAESIDPVVVLQNILSDNWNAGNCPKPKIAPITDYRRFDCNNEGDGCLIYEITTEEVKKDAPHDWVGYVISMSVDMRTMHSRDRLIKLRDEVRRIINLKRNTPHNSYDKLWYRRKKDLSDKSRLLWRLVVDCDFEVICEKIT